MFFGSTRLWHVSVGGTQQKLTTVKLLNISQTLSICPFFTKTLKTCTFRFYLPTYKVGRIQISFKRDKHFPLYSVSFCLQESFSFSVLYFFTVEQIISLFGKQQRMKLSLFSQSQSRLWEAWRWPIDRNSASNLHMCAIRLRAVYVCIQASLICRACWRCHPASSHAPPNPPTHIYTPHTSSQEEEDKVLLPVLCWSGWMAAAQGGREQGKRGIKHKEKAWLVCEFSTCNLSYGELSCSLLFGSNRLMPGVCLNKSTMHSSG